MGKQLPSIINRAGIAVAAMCLPQCFLSVGCKFHIVEWLVKKKEKSPFSYFGIFAVCEYFFLRNVIIGVSPQRDCENFSPSLSPLYQVF